MKNLIKLLDSEVLKTSKATNKNAAVTAALKNIRNSFKLDLKDVIEINGKLEFIYKIENTAAPVYITATANKTPRIWEKISYLIL